MEPIRRICLFSGPGAGKSTTAAWLFSQLKLMHVEVELVQEYIKTWSYENRPPVSWDQLYLLSKQIRKEDIVLRNGVDLLVTDSPVFLSTCYAKAHGSPAADHLVQVAREFDKFYRPLNILINRGEIPYNPSGRYQDEAGAKRMDRFIADSLVDNGMEYETAKFNDLPGTLEIVKRALFPPAAAKSEPCQS